MSGPHNITDTNEAHDSAWDRLAVRSVQAYPARFRWADLLAWLTDLWRA